MTPPMGGLCRARVEFISITREDEGEGWVLMTGQDDKTHPSLIPDTTGFARRRFSREFSRVWTGCFGLHDLWKFEVFRLE